MRTRTALAAVMPMMFGLCSGGAAWADTPRTDAPAAVEEAPKIQESDRWFVVLPSDQPNARGNVHIAIKKSDKAEAPVRISYEVSFSDEGGLGRAEIENFCLNDEWFSPVKVTMNFKGDRKDNPPAMSAAITRPDPKSTAGKMKVESAEGQNIPEQDIKEHTVLWLTPLEMVLRLPFDKDKKLDFAMLDMVLTPAGDCTLSYQGEEEIEVKGQKQTAHKFLQKIGDSGMTNEFWLDGNHQIIRARIDKAMVTPATKEEAVKAVEGK